MAFGLSKSEEEKAEKRARTAAAEQEKDAKAFEEGPVGRARAAFQAGSAVFQFSTKVMDQDNFFAIFVSSTQRSSDPSEVLDAICKEGWELVNGSFVFVHQGSKSADKVVMSGQRIDVKGQTVGYYLFRRNAGSH